MTYKYFVIDEIEFEIGDYLSLRIENVKYTPGTPGRFHGLPENWEEPEGSDVNFDDIDCYLIYCKDKKILAYQAPVHFAENYIDDIIEQCEYEVKEL